MFIIVAKFNIREGQEEEAKKALATMVNAVKDNEPGVLNYSAHIDRENPSQVVFYEVYKDKEALGAHQGTDHMNAMTAAFKTTFKGPLEIQRLEMVEGFSR